MSFIFDVKNLVIKMSFELLMLKRLSIIKWLTKWQLQYSLIPRNCSD